MSHHLLAPKRLLLMAGICLSTLSLAQNRAAYDYTVIKLKYPPTQPIRDGLTYKTTYSEKSNRLDGENIARLRGFSDINIKFSRKTPELIIHYDIVGIEIKDISTVSERNLYFKDITYTLVNRLVFRKADGTEVKTLVIDDGTKPRKQRVGSNFFVQNNMRDSYYPKPSDFTSSPNVEIDKRPEPSGFVRLETIEEFMKKYGSFVEAKTEAFAFEDAFKESGEVLNILFGTQTYYDRFTIANVTTKTRQGNFDDFDKAAADMAAGLALLKGNVNDPKATELFQSSLNFYKGLETSNDPRLAEEQTKTVAICNLAVLSAMLNDTNAAESYYAQYLTRNGKTMLAQIYLDTLIKFRKQLGKRSNYPEGILAGL